MKEILDAFNYLGSSLDKMGPRPLRGLLAGHPRELASIVPFSDKIGLTDPNEVQYGRDVTNKWGLTDAHDQGAGSHAIGLLADALIDPVGLAAGGYGAYRGLKHANRLLDHAGDLDPFQMGFMGKDVYPTAHRSVNEAADWIGPMHDPQAGQAMLAPHMNEELERAFSRMQPGNAARAYAELPEGSSLLGRGSEGPVFKTPYGSAIKFQPNETTFGEPASRLRRAGITPPIGRPDIQEMLRPHRSNVYGGEHHGVRVEHMPLVDPLHDENYRLWDYFNHISRQGAMPASEQAHLEALLSQNEMIGEGLGHKMRQHIGQTYSGLDPYDVRGANVARTAAGNLAIHDAGAIRPMNPQALRENMHGLQGYPTAPMPSRGARHELLREGSPEELRRVLEELAAAGTQGQGVPAPSYVGLGDAGGPMIQNPLGVHGQNLAEIRDFLSRYAHLLVGQQ